MTGRILQPLRRSDALWLAPGAPANGFEAVRERLEALVSVPRSGEVYSAKRRSIYRLEDERLGSLAVKEMRHDGAWRRLVHRTVRRRRALSEYRVGTGFEARGGATPHFFAAAVEQQPWTLRRVLLFIEWVEGAETLTQYLARLGDPPATNVLQRVADELAAAARLGLVHGRHSSENLLVDASAEPPHVQTIDFAYAHLEPAFDGAAFPRDVARVAHWLWHERISSDETLRALFECCACAAWPDAPTRDRVVLMEAELARWKRRKPR